MLDEEDCNVGADGRRPRLGLCGNDGSGRSSLARRMGPGIAGGLVAGAVIGGLASSAYGWGPGYGYYGGPGYYSAGYYGGPYAYDYDEPYSWGGGYTTTYYTAPVSYGYRYRRVVRPAYAYYHDSYPIVRHHWHRHYRYW
ncbi:MULTISPECIES: hypothetical protein [Bradyrhizobium]|uniref:hypothetical protein n=1 Tax=Bradyrhizobium TaxID=374 RepID=UPI001E43E41C|nr:MULTISPECIES: hypothetical protein [Bradyrhizobium]UFW49030.1 hypothetical protein BaraCB756_43545 [Bradyrhizobium arachidis]